MKSQEKITNILKEKGITDLHKGVQLHANQHDKEYSISVGYMATELHINKEEIDPADFQGDEMFKLCPSWYWTK